MSAQESFSYRTWPFYWLVRANGWYRARMEELLRPTGLDSARWRVLTTLHEDRVASVKEIADHSSTKLPTMTRIIQRMEADGLVQRRPRHGNDRIMEVVLTAHGEELGKQAWAAADELYHRAFRGMSDADLDTLRTLLQTVASNLAEP